MRVVARGDASRLMGVADEQPASLISLRSLVAPFASLGAGLLGAAAPPPPPLKEQRTGVVFPGELEYCADHKGCPVITGAGARSKRLVGIKNLDIYAVALFVDPTAVHSALGGHFRGASCPEALARDQALFDELVANEGVEKTLRIVITSGLVKRKAFLEALEERLEPPLKQAGELAAMEAFTRQFDAAQFRKGLQITFTTKGSRLETQIDGQQVGSIANRALSHSLLDIYLGEDPASKGAKESIGRGLAAMVLA